MCQDPQKRLGATGTTFHSVEEERPLARLFPMLDKDYGNGDQMQLVVITAG
jgi:hypothetical protein